MCGLGTELSQPLEPSGLWCPDYKGEFMLGIAATAIHSLSPTSVRIGACAVRAQQAISLVAAARDSDRAHQNRRHERMHLTLKKRGDETCRPQCAAATSAVRRVRRALQPGPPAPGVRHESPRRPLRAIPTRLPRTEDLTYPFHDRTATVTHCGRICFNRRKINLSQVFAGQNVGVTEVGDRIWLVTVSSL